MVTPRDARSSIAYRRDDSSRGVFVAGGNRNLFILGRRQRENLWMMIRLSFIG